MRNICKICNQNQSQSIIIKMIKYTIGQSAIIALEIGRMAFHYGKEPDIRKN